ncbi:MAG: 50S ribosomal protein L7/L12 [Actinomycetota bacterium]|nr:50S ribosomal protein L7/L12 [Actinomycetota bacterium]
MAEKLSPEQALEAMKSWTVMELAQFVKLAEEEFGVSAQPQVVSGPVSGGAAETTEAASEEKEQFDVILTSVGEKKIPVIKEIRTITNLGLKEAKALAEEAPKPVKEGVSKEEAEKIKEQLEKAGATVELK